MNTYTVSQLMAQAECYNILAELFSEPENGVHDYRKLYNKLVNSTGILKPKALGMARKLRKTTFNLKTADLIPEYNRLFADPATALAYPCSSMYISKNKTDVLLLEWISDFYIKAGFEEKPATNPVDHISTELKFIYHLLHHVAKGFQSDDIAMVNRYSDLRCQFIREHMIKWVPEFTRCILQHSVSPYYLQLSILNRTLLINCTGENIEIPE